MITRHCFVIAAFVSLWTATAVAQEPLPVPALPPAAPVAPVPGSAPLPPAPRVAPVPFHADQPFPYVDFDDAFDFDHLVPEIDFDFDHAFQYIEFDHAFTPFAEPLVALQAPGSAPPTPIVSVRAPRPAPAGQADRLYEQAMTFIDRDQYDRAVDTLDRIIAAKQTRADAAMYWKAYSLSKMARAADALAAIGELQKQYADSAWVRDARFLEVEVRQAAGQAVSADAQVDEETKLLALQGLMRSDPDAALPVIEKLLAGDSSVRVKERALFVVSRSRSPRARQVITGVAKGASNPDLRMAAIGYLGMMSGPESRQALQEIYRGTSDLDVKRRILRSFMVARDRDALLAVAKSESNVELRGEAVQQLGAMRAAAELEELYRAETNAEVRRRILQALFAAGAVDRLAPIARSEKDPELRRTAIRSLGVSNRPEATETLVSIYNADASTEIKEAVIGALGTHRNGAAALVTLARAEKNPELKQDIVRRLSTSRAPAARDYLLELLQQ